MHLKKQEFLALKVVSQKACCGYLENKRAYLRHNNMYMAQFANLEVL